MKYWLFKSEPDAFSIDALAAAPRRTSHWDGVRNFQARNMMRDGMKRGDLGFFYHSSCAEPGIVGIVKVVREGYPDHTAFDAGSKYFDADSDPSSPRWFMVDVQLVRRFAQPVTLERLRRHAEGKLKDMLVLRRGNRLSITPVTEQEWKFINTLAGE
jgi:predicted RNA-binding protein with PUA-like domain